MTDHVPEQRARRDRRRTRPSALLDRTPAVARAVRARVGAPAARRGVVVPGRRPLPDLPRPRAGRARVGRRRQRVRRLPRRLRRQCRRPRAPEDRRGDRAGRAHGHALRRDRRRPRSRSPRSCAGASASSRCASPTPAPRRRWTRSASRAPPPGATTVAEDRGLVPRPPRHGDVLGRARTPTPWAGATSPRRRRCRRASRPILAEYTLVVPFNDAAALERLLDERGGEIACLIMEPVMMNIGIVVPEPGLPRGACATCCTGTASC